MENVLVFATSVEFPLEVSELTSSLDALAGKGKWNFDLGDCDRILRVASACPAEAVIALVESAGYRCAELGDEVPEMDWLEDRKLAS